MSDAGSDSDQNDLLKALEAHGQAFLSSFTLPGASSSKVGHKRRKLDGKKHEKLHDSEAEDDDDYN